MAEAAPAHRGSATINADDDAPASTTVEEQNTRIMALSQAARLTRPIAKAAGYDFYHKVLGSPKYVMAPMVDQSELPWRMLAKNYGTHLSYTPMFNANSFNRSESFRASQWSTCPEERPVIVQFCANDPSILLEAALRVERDCDAVDLNLGCPQHIAKRGHYGSFLMEDWELIGMVASDVGVHV